MKELAQGIASLGRGPDTELVHMTKGEIAALQRLAMANGGSLTINPHTGLPEAGILSSLLPMLAGAAVNFFLPGAGFALPALAGGLTGALLNKDRPGIGAVTGALSGFGGGNVAGTIAGAGESAAATEFAKEAAEAGATAQQGIMNQPVADYITPDVRENLMSEGPMDPNSAGFKAAQETQANIARQAAENTSTAMPQQSYLDKLQKGISSPGLVNKLMKENKGDMMMALSPLAASALGLGGGTAAKMTPPGYGASNFTPRGPRTRSTNDYLNQPGNGEKLYFSDTSLANYGMAEGGMANSAPNLNFAQPQIRVDPMQQNLNNYGEPVGYADGGIMGEKPNITQQGIGRFPPPYNEQNSGFFDKMPRRQPIAGGYTPFSLYGPGGFKPSAPQKAPPTQAEATAAAPPPPPAPEPKLVPPWFPNDNYTGGYMAGGGSVGYAQGGISNIPNTYAAGGKLLRGPGDGVSDSIPAVITGPKPQRAALADGEFVIPARIVSELGNGSTEAGARKLYAMMDRVQHARKKSIGRDKVAVNSKAEKLLPA
jgi:hypothetical protein